MVPSDTVSDPYPLDFPGPRMVASKPTWEAAILRGLEAFLLEVSTSFTFVERQKPMIIDDKELHLDLLLHRQPL